MAAINDVTDLTNEGDVAVLTLNSPPVNALSAKVREGIHKGIQAAIDDASVKSIVLICEGRTFIAGADISEFGSGSAPQGPNLFEAQSMIEDAPKPVIAAIHGTALGGGLEVALTCHYRVAVPSAKCGLPEVNLGLLPGAGGTQRLPRVVGPEKALQMVTSGQHVGAKQCLDMGLVDELATEGNIRADAIAFASKIVSEGRPLKKIRDSNEKVEAARGKPEIFDTVRKAIARKTRGFLAPEYNIQCIEAAVNLPFDEGIKVERKLFAELLSGEQSAAQQHVFFAERQVWKIPGIAKDQSKIDVKKVGIIGAGTMGGGISMNFANAGIEVVIVERDQAPLDKGLATIRKNYERTAKKGRITTADVEARTGLISGATDMNALADCDLIIEAVFENMDVKQDIFRQLDKICKKGAILATNTSALNIDEIAAVTSRPEAVIGLHFFSPANVMRLLEVVRADKSSDEVIATSMAIAKKIGKIAALVGVCPGFVGNRILAQRQREANKLIMEGAMPWDVDRVLFDFGLPMGPFAMSDLAGLDLGWRQETSNPDGVLRDRLVELDRRGQKTGAGFYDYDENRKATPSKIVEDIIIEFSEKTQNKRRDVSDDEILERCVYPMINEGFKILEEGKAIRASDIDIVWINGYGWPVYRGGPMFYGAHIGLDKVLAKMKEFEAAYGEAFKPAALLETMVADGKTYAEMGY